MHYACEPVTICDQFLRFVLGKDKHEFIPYSGSLCYRRFDVCTPLFFAALRKKVAELRVETTNAEIARLRFACRAVEGLAKVTVIWYNSRRSRMETVSQFAVASSNSDAAYA